MSMSAESVGGDHSVSAPPSIVWNLSDSLVPKSREPYSRWMMRVE